MHTAKLVFAGHPSLDIPEVLKEPDLSFFVAACFPRHFVAQVALIAPVRAVFHKTATFLSADWPPHRESSDSLAEALLSVTTVVCPSRVDNTEAVPALFLNLSRTMILENNSQLVKTCISFQ
jgi:hypothetical protein